MSKLVSQTNNQGFCKIILEQDTVGVYVFVYESQQSVNPERDYLQDDMQLAQEFCLEDFGVPLRSWDALSD